MSKSLFLRLGIQGALIVFLAFTGGAIAQAAEYLPNQVYKGGMGEALQIEDALVNIQPGTVLVLGEQHGTKEQAEQQLQILKKIKENGHLVSVGMEFFEAQAQPLVDAWRNGELSEAQFLKQVGWGGFPFEFYRQQSIFPQVSLGEQTVALNASRKLTGKIAKSGLASLTDEERAQLPPGFQLGNAGYLERFKGVMGDHLPSAEAVERYFAAQSVWDDTMAYQAAEFVQNHPEHIFVIIVGEFHVQYGGGLPDRLKARGIESVMTFSLVNVAGLSDQEQIESVQPHEVFGPRADFVMISNIVR